MALKKNLKTKGTNYEAIQSIHAVTRMVAVYLVHVTNRFSGQLLVYSSFILPTTHLDTSYRVNFRYSESIKFSTHSTVGPICLDP